MTSVLLVVGLMVLGLALIAVEVLVLPGVGLIGFLGLASIGGAGYVAFTELGAQYGGLAIVGGVLAAGLMFWILPKSKVGKSMVLEHQTTAKAGDPTLVALVGHRGKALTPLRPAGTAEIDDRTIDVVTDGVYIESNTEIEVVSVQGSRVLVARSGADSSS